MKLLLRILLSLPLLACSIQAAERPLHLFILSGQSNMDAMDPEAGFAPEARKLLPGAEVVYLKYARGGQKIRKWVKEWNSIATKHGLEPVMPEKRPRYYDIILQRYAALIEEYPAPDSVTFCWMQGGADANGNLSAAYPDALKQLIANLRRDLKQPAMNVVIGRLSDFRKGDNKSWTAVREAHVNVANSDPRGAWVDCDDLNDKPRKRGGGTTDELHYTKQGYIVLGQRYARQAKALIDGEEPAPNGRPALHPH